MRGDWQRGSGESRARAGAPFFWFAGPRDERGIWYTCIEGMARRPPPASDSCCARVGHISHVFETDVARDASRQGLSFNIAKIGVETPRVETRKQVLRQCCQNSHVTRTW